MRVLIGAHTGRTLTIARVRMFGADPGYYLCGGEGLYEPRHVELVAERAGGNPCGADCDTRTHYLIGTCDHCAGTCRHPKETP